MAQARDASERKEAIEKLLETKNVNLLSTVVDIGLHSGDESMIRLAIGHIDRLNSMGLSKIKSGIEELLKDKGKLAETAREILQKYY